MEHAELLELDEGNSSSTDTGLPMLRHAVWLVSTALPLVSSFAWLGLAWHTRRPRYAFQAVLYLIWPVIGFLTGATFVVIAGLESSGENELAFMGIACAVMWAASLVNAHREWRTLDATLSAAHSLRAHHSLDEHFPTFDRHDQTPAAIASEDDDSSAAGLYVLGYFLWLTLGWLGAHRFYAGRWLSGLAYACSFGFGGAGWAADVFLLPAMIDDVRARERSKRLTQGRAPSSHTPARWTETRSRFSWLDFSLRLGFFLTAPVILTVLCIMLKHYELLAVVLVVVVTCGLLGNIERALAHMSIVEKVPLLGKGVPVFRDLYEYYSAHRPRPFLFYLFYPVSAPLWSARSPRVREEFRHYWKILRPLLLVILLQQVLTYRSTYPPHLGPEEAFVRVFVLSFFAALSTTMFLVPMVTTSFALNLSGRHLQLKFLSIVCLMLAVPMGVYCYHEQTHHISFLGSDLLEERMATTTFRDELRAAADMFLSYQVRRIENPNTQEVAERPDLTAAFRRHIAGMTVGDENNGFVVFTLPGESAKAGDVWLGVKLWYGNSDEPADVLFLMSPDQHLYTSWSELPHGVRERFRVFAGEELPDDQDVSQRPEFIATQTLIRDWH